MSVSTEPRLLEEKTVDAIVQDADGRIIHNSFQLDDPVVIRRYDDGMRHLVSSRTGLPIVAPHDPSTLDRSRCPHCHEPLGGPKGTT